MNRTALAQLLTEVVPLARKKKFSSGSYIFRQGAPATGCYIVQSGVVELTLDCKDGREMLVELVPAGSLVGLSGSFGENYILSARAAMKTSVAFIPRERLLELLETHPEAKRLMLLALSENIEHVQRLTSTLLSVASPEPLT